MPQAIATTNHDVIRRWVEERKGHPSVVKATQGQRRGRAGLLRIDFAAPDEGLEQTSWEDFFETFDSNNLAFLYQEQTATGRKSRFCKFVSRDAVQLEEQGAGETERPTHH